ncbi:putative oxidoreductase SSP0419 [Clavelina lepadiformis]|uniref:putative oxidoreductase SSP0419 n=1 Tax=Clavelina lepadiformis TaxID=159417 RepID=UPI004041E29C
MTEFADNVILVTGASSGIGAATAKAFAKQGASLSLVGRDRCRLAEVAEECANNGAKGVLQVIADVEKEKDLDRIVRETTDKFDKIHILINSAGYAKFSLVKDLSVNEIDSIFKVNVRAILYLIKLSLPYLEKTKGNVINISSTASSIYALTSAVVYSTTKAACDHLTKAAAYELATTGVRVNSVNPAVVETNMCEYAGFSEEQTQNYFETNKKMHPLGQRNIKLEEVVDAILFLASDRARMITGTCMRVDGGCGLAGQ